MNEKFQKLMEKLDADEQLADALFSKETPEEAQALLKEAGFDFKVADILELREEFTKIIEQNDNGELSDETLADVAGGGILQGALDGVVGLANRGFGNTISRHTGLPPIQRIRLPRVPRRW